MATDTKLLGQRLKALDARLSSSELETVASLFVPRELADGEALITEGTAPGAFALTWDGKLMVRADVSGRTVEIGHLPPGLMVGEVSFLDGGTATATVTADGPATVLVFTRAAYDELERTKPHVAMKLLHVVSRTLAGRVRTATDLYEVGRDDDDEMSYASADTLYDVFRSLYGMGLP